MFLSMQHIQGISRHQLQINSLEDKITLDNLVLVYNIKRTMNILGVPDLIAKLQKGNSPYKRKFLFLLKTSYLKRNTGCNFYQTQLSA